MYQSNAEFFRKHNGPFEIDGDVLEVTNCFMRHGVHWVGTFGMMGSEIETNPLKFFRKQGFFGGGMIVFPNTIKLGLRDLSFVDKYNVHYAWDRAFSGTFPYRGHVYNLESLTLDIHNMSIDRVMEIAKDIAHNQWDTDLIVKMFPTKRIFVVKRRDPFWRVVAWMPHTNTYLPHVPGTPKFDDLQRDTAILADEQVDKLYPFLPNKITSDFSRFAVDLERYADDAQEPMAQKGMGYLYNRLISGLPFDRSVFVGGDDFFKRYYAQKHDELKQAVERIGDGAILLDLHSFNPEPLACDTDKNPDRPDICLGFNNDDTKPADEVLHALKTHFEQNGLRVAFNTPFSGAMTTNTRTKYTSLMLEINKRCYLANHTLSPNANRLSAILRGAILLL
jgi:N-formylglutamate amidohydrolase